MCIPCTYSLWFLHFCWTLVHIYQVSNQVYDFHLGQLTQKVWVRYDLLHICPLLGFPNLHHQNRCNNSIVFPHRSFPKIHTLINVLMKYLQITYILDQVLIFYCFDYNLIHFFFFFCKLVLTMFFKLRKTCKDLFVFL